MIDRQYINYNGSLHFADEAVLPSNNRAFCYGDGLFETIRCNASNVLHFDKHFRRLEEGLEILKIDKPEGFTRSKLEYAIEKLILKNKLFLGGRVRLSVFRQAGGLYTPTQKNAEYLIQATSLKNKYYELNAAGIKVGIYPDIRKQLNYLANIKSVNALLYVMAGQYKVEQGWGEVLILNEKNKIAESGSSNIFLVKNRTLTTPPLSEGCISGVMRRIIIGLAKEIQYEVREAAVSVSLMENADEVFLTNAINGIQWIGAFNQKRYYHKVAGEFIRALNKLSFGDKV